MEISPSSEATSSRPGRAWLVAVFIWLAVCCTLAVVVLAEVQVSGLPGLSTPRGSQALGTFVQRALLCPGLLLPALVLIRPRWSVIICGLMLLATAVMLVLAIPRSQVLQAYLPFWVGAVLPVVFAGTATWLAYWRREWQARRSLSSAHEP